MTRCTFAGLRVQLSRILQRTHCSVAPPSFVGDRMTAIRTAVEHVDVLIVGSGISGIGAGRYLRTEHPSKSFAILEARGASGGTWDLFRYPGIRSDSDLH